MNWIHQEYGYLLDLGNGVEAKLKACSTGYKLVVAYNNGFEFVVSYYPITRFNGDIRRLVEEEIIPRAIRWLRSYPLIDSLDRISTQLKEYSASK